MTEKVFHGACVGIVEVFLWLLAVSCAPLLVYLADVFGGCGLLCHVEEASITVFHKWLLVHG